MRSLAAIALSIAVLATGTAQAGQQVDSPLLAAPPSQFFDEPRRSGDADAATYEKCMKLTQNDPAAAQRLAQGWQARGGAHPADHCLAVALIGLKQYKEAAARLESLAQAMIRAPAALRAGVLDQAAQARLLAGDPGRAYADDSSALSLRPDDIEVLVDRAEAAGDAGWFDKAVADLDRVLKADPTRVDALIYRASAYRALSRLDAAYADINAALKLSPASASALLERGNIRRLKEDTGGARQDWQRVANLAPGSAAATAATANIARLDAAAKAASQPRQGAH